MKRSSVIALSIVTGLVLACAILPLGMMALLLGVGGSSSGPARAPRWQEQLISGHGMDRVVVIDVRGIIGARDEALFSAEPTHEQLLAQIRQATDDARVKAVVVRIDSPGGGVVASNELYTALKKLRTAEKRLVMSLGPTAASGGYYIATAGERIYANPDTVTGSLGVIVSLVNAAETYRKLGLEPYTYKSGPFKDIGAPTHAPTADEATIWQGVIDQAYQGFVDVIVAGRQLPRDEVLRLADGRIYTGKQALDLKLVDALGGQDEAIAEAQALAGLEDARVVRYRSSGSLRALLLNRLEQQQQPSDPLGLRALIQPRGPVLEYRMIQ